QWFLQKHFTLRPENPILGLKSRHGEDEVPIIPLVGTAADEIKLAPWPALPEQKLAELRAALERRLDPMVANSIGALLKGMPILRLAARLSWWRQRRKVVDTIMQIIKDGKKFADGSEIYGLVTSHQFEPLERRSIWTRLQDRFGYRRAV